MKLVVGLGNPGLFWAGSRHNIGFTVVKSLAKQNKIALKRDSGTFALSGKGKIDSQNCILALPLTFMNLSGKAVLALLKKYKLDLDSLLVVCDDLDLELGRLKLRPSGSSGGQRGLNSVIDSTGSQSFSRLRIGIGRPPRAEDSTDYVLKHFSRREKQELKDIIERASDCCQSWASYGTVETMNIFNKSLPAGRPDCRQAGREQNRDSQDNY